jgi:hypothetical protein
MEMKRPKTRRKIMNNKNKTQFYVFVNENYSKEKQTLMSFDAMAMYSARPGGEFCAIKKHHFISFDFFEYHSRKSD